MRISNTQKLNIRLIILLIVITAIIATVVLNYDHNRGYAETYVEVREWITFTELMDNLIQEEVDRQNTLEAEREIRNAMWVESLKQSIEVIENNKIEAEKVVVQQVVPKAKMEVSRNIDTSRNTFTITAYDLSYQSCEKTMSDPGYGVTASGFNLKGMSREEAMTIAADTSVIPMGSRVYIQFINESYKKFNGVYTVRDRGGAIKGAKIDIFMGDFAKHETDQSVWDFGKVQAKLYKVAD